MSPGNPFILGSRGHRSRLQGTETVPAWVCALLSTFFECWLLLRHLFSVLLPRGWFCWQPVRL